MAKKNLFDPNPSGLIEHDHNNDGIDRPGFLRSRTEQLRSVLGVSDVNYVQVHHALGLVDSSFV